MMRSVKIWLQVLNSPFHSVAITAAAATTVVVVIIIIYLATSYTTKILDKRQ